MEGLFLDGWTDDRCMSKPTLIAWAGEYHTITGVKRQATREQMKEMKDSVHADGKK